MSDLISINGLTKRYKSKTVVDQVNLTVSAGQILGLVGPNGAGKTTCLQAMLGLIDYEGSVKMLGLNPRAQRQQMLKDVAYWDFCLCWNKEVNSN